MVTIIPRTGGRPSPAAGRGVVVVAIIAWEGGRGLAVVVVGGTAVGVRVKGRRGSGRGC